MAILVCEDRAAEKAKGYAVQDCAAATQNILLAAHTKGFGAVWTTVFPQNADAVRKLLGIPEHAVPFSCVPVGRPAPVSRRRRAGSTTGTCTTRRWGGRGGAR